MRKILINGGNFLYGNVEISGMKNAALPVIYATILANDVCILENIPTVSDVTLSLEILTDMGAKVRRINSTSVEIDTSCLAPVTPSADLVSRIRASTYLLGACLGRFGKAAVPYPGGCDIGPRPLNFHMEAFKKLGADVSNDNGMFTADAPDGLRGSMISLEIPSVGATVNSILAAVFASGTTIIHNAAREPHIIDLAGFLNNCGADIRGAGTNVIKVVGVKSLHGTSYKILPDMIEAGTYMVAAAACGGMVNICSVVPKHLEAISARLIDMGVGVEAGGDRITVTSNGFLKATDIKTGFYPGFPTDMHPQFAVLLAMAKGVSTITDSVFDNRFKYADQLEKMNANVKVSGNTAIFVGCDLKAAPVVAPDLRAGAALVIAGLAADGVTEISNVELIERGYVNIINKLRALGADIVMRVEPDAVATPSVG
ncbi:MAG: UDP-N-acetylglucosamine 1-carboxyvinyltransferase [Clostridia bacterium]|nr:UDP-N-acetylglucosamine 1-carboxyvinyltransferase [Clostridia bacterium]